jgi:NifU-like protein involved in Fe-S cluster formation
VARGTAPTYSRPVPSALYSRDILRLASAIPHLGRLERPGASAEKSSPVCGSRIVVDVGLDEKGRVSELGQEVKACALGQASASLMAAHALGRTGAELESARDSLAAYLAGRSDRPGDWPGLEIFAEARRITARHGSILLAFDAAAEAVAKARSR